MPQAGNTGAGDGGAQDGDNTDDTLNNQDDANTDTDADNDQDTDQDGDQDVKLPKTQAELDKMLKNRLDRQKKALEKKHQAELKKATDQKDKSELELEKQKATDLVQKITDKNFLLAAKDAGASAAQADKLLKLMRADFEADDDGEITNIEDLIETAKSDFSELFGGKGKGSGDGGAGGDDKIKDPVKAFNDSIKSELGY